jgi:hypothetical protein
VIFDCAVCSALSPSKQRSKKRRGSLPPRRPRGRALRFGVTSGLLPPGHAIFFSSGRRACIRRDFRGAVSSGPALGPCAPGSAECRGLRTRAVAPLRFFFSNPEEEARRQSVQRMLVTRCYYLTSVSAPKESSRFRRAGSARFPSGRCQADHVTACHMMRADHAWPAPPSAIRSLSSSRTTGRTWRLVGHGAEVCAQSSGRCEIVAHAGSLAFGGSPPRPPNASRLVA